MSGFKFELKKPNIKLFDRNKSQAFIKQEVGKTIDTITSVVKTNIVFGAPVGGTGNLKNSIKSERDGFTGSVFTNVGYASVVENGRRAAPVAESADDDLRVWITRSRKGRAYFQSLKSKYKNITLKGAIFLLKRGKKRKPTKANPFFQRGIDRSFKRIRRETTFLLEKIRRGLATQ